MRLVRINEDLSFYEGKAIESTYTAKVREALKKV